MLLHIRRELPVEHKVPLPQSLHQNFQSHDRFGLVSIILGLEQLSQMLIGGDNVEPIDEQLASLRNALLVVLQVVEFALLLFSFVEFFLLHNLLLLLKMKQSLLQIIVEL